MDRNQWVKNRSAACRFYDGKVCCILERSGLFGVSESGQSDPTAGSIRPAGCPTTSSRTNL